MQTPDGQSDGSTSDARRPKEPTPGKRWRRLDTMLADARAQLAPEARNPPMMAVLRALACSPGFQLLLLWRTAALMYRSGRALRVMSRFLSLGIRIIYGCDLDLRARIGRGACFPHPIGIVIGQGVEIGDRATVLQNVTIGVVQWPSSEFPKIREGATIWAGAVIVGNIVIGARSYVGANAVVLQDVPADCTAVGVPARIMPSRKRHSPKLTNE